LAAIDPAEKRRLFERLSSVREIVFGVQDGVLTTAGVLCGLSGAVSQHSQVALAALASTAVVRSRWLQEPTWARARKPRC
jgi:hypothetical protein